MLFVIPADSKDIGKEYQILLDELRRYNPEMLDKQRLIAISKSDMLDDELTQEMDAILKEEFNDVEYLFISSVAQKGYKSLRINSLAAFGGLVFRCPLFYRSQLNLKIS